MDDATYQKLRSDLLAGVLEPGDAPGLLAHLRAHPGLREELGRSLAIDRLLPLASEPAGESACFSEEVAQRIRTAPQAEVFARSVRQRITPARKRFPWPRVALPLAAALALLAVGTWFFQGPAPLARIAAVEDVTWAPESILRGGDPVAAGEVLAIESGLLSLDLPGRGQVVLEGPAALVVLGSKHLSLDHGRATFTVTPGGRGLTVDTPHGTVVDLGTAFALEVSGEDCELHVIEGEVEFTGPGEGPRPLLAGQSLRSGGSGTVEIPSLADRFVRHLPEPARTRSHVRWSCQEGHGRLAAASGAASAAPLQLRSAFPEGAPPRWDSADGRAGLRFDGESSYVRARYPGVLGSQARTVALWVKVPTSWSPEDGGTLVSWGRSEWQQAGLLFELTLNRDAAKGPLGAPQLDTYGHTATAGQSLCDDRWHHLAVTTSQGPDGSGATQVLFHLDGHLLDSSPRSLPRIDTVASGGGEVVVGRSIQGLASPEPPREVFFRGMLSEVVIAAQALTAQELQRMIQTGDPW